MSWLGDIKRRFVYSCRQGCGEVGHVMPTVAHSPDKEVHGRICPKCAEPLDYKHFENVSANEGGFAAPPTVMEFEQNGRKAVKIGSTYMSKTKHNYMESGKVKNEYTEAFKESEVKKAADTVRRDMHKTAKVL